MLQSHQQGLQQGGPPGVNQLPTPRATLKVVNIPSFVTQDDFSRLMLQLEGCVEARLLGRQPGGDQVGYSEFTDKLNASKAKNLYHGWTGWGGRGLTIELTDFSMSQLTQLPGQKRLREAEDLLQPNGNFKQARPDVPPMGMAGAMGGGQQLQPQGLISQPGMQQPLGMQQQPGMQQPQQQQQQDTLGLLQNLSNMTSLLQQQGIAQQLLAAAAQQQQQQQTGGIGMGQQPQQQGAGLQQLQPQGQGMMAPQQQQGGGLMQTGMMQQGQAAGGFESYNPAAVSANNRIPQQQPQPQQQLGGMMGGSMLPPQQQAPQYAAPQMQQQPQQPLQYGMQQEQPGAYVNQQPVQQPQQQMLQPVQQPAYGMAPQQQQQPVMVQGGMGQMSNMQQQPILQQQPQQPMLQQQQQQPQMIQPQQEQQQQGMGMQGGRRGDVVAPAGMRQYPPDACNTLYIEGLPADVTRRELAHIFRSHDGYRSLRLVIKDSKKHVGEKLVMAFVEYSNTYFATEAMDALQGYPFDLDNPETVTFFLKYARPMENPHRRPPAPGGAIPMMGGRGGRGGGGPGPDVHVHGGRGGGGRGGRFGSGGGPPRESPRRPN